MRDALRHECLVEHERSLGKPAVDVSVRPLPRRLTFGQLAFVDGRKISCRPFDLPEVDAAVRYVAFGTRIGPARKQALERVDRKRQLFDVVTNQLERFGSN
jgi:hypothetical protein